MARFVVSHRLAGRDSSAIQAAADAHESIRAKIRGFANVVSDRPPAPNARGLMVVDADPGEMLAQQRTAPADLLIEPEMFRRPARFALTSLPVARAGSAGTGAAYTMTVRSPAGPAPGAKVEVLFSNPQTGASAAVETFSDAQGRAAVPYDSRQWLPGGVIVTPRSGQWSWFSSSTASGSVLTLAALPQGNRLGWWHQLLGVPSYLETRGQGIRVGVADTGAGPHPCLAQVQSAGAFLDGAHDAAPLASADVSDHGTHVAGLIGARPPAGSTGYAGIAPAVDLVVARVYRDSTSAASNADIAGAIDALSGEHACDLINLSLGGTESSVIELDAVTAAIENGTLVLGAAGNGVGPIDYPAAYNGVVAVSALGLYGTFPLNAIEALAVPSAADHFAGSLFSASFNNTGPHLACIGPGVAIISTVPGTSPADAAYASMSGTSMACPAVTGALATLLSADSAYRKLPRDVKRAQYAWNVLLRSLRRAGFNSTYEGYGLATASAT